MESSEEENEGVSGNHVPKELRPLASDGVKFIDEVLDGQNERCLEKFRMDKHVFYKLCDILQAKGLLRHTNRVKIEEQLAIFMFIIGHNLRTRAVQELFHLSGETISRHFNNVLNAIITPYYSKEFPNDYHPQNATELFNQRHSLLRNVTDRTFGALKARFPILMSAPSYPLQTQVKLVVAACVLHNYIRREKPDDWIFKMYENASFPMEESQPPLEMEVPPKMNVETQTQSSDHTFDAEEIAFASQLRDSITTEMWNDFINDFGRM
uniref:DUF8040 domain-containing protein n=1 Tax=Cajanus cajan TaxID=3821 RepID=A0A151T349_CAJCA|nr:hypothetical protein KK1_015937 [Cajanus cajan]